MNDEFLDDERLYRSILPKEMYITPEGTVTAAAFIDRRGGLSVDRGDGRSDTDSIRWMRTQGKIGRIAYVTAEDCKMATAVPKYKPSCTNKYHSEIWSSDDKAVMEIEQAECLADRVVFCEGE